MQKLNSFNPEGFLHLEKHKKCGFKKPVQKTSFFFAELGFSGQHADLTNQNFRVPTELLVAEWGYNMVQATRFHSDFQVNSK